MTPRLQLFITLLLHFEAGISDGIVLHHRAGDDVVLPPDFDSHYPCSDVDWILYNPYINFIVRQGNIVKTSPGAERMSLSSNCSLIINNITAEDAGLYNCRIRKTLSPTSVYLNVLTVSPYQPHGDPGRDGDVTLRCSLKKYLYGCEKNSIIWVDETGTVLLGEGDGFVSGGQNNCVSDLMVKHQRCSKRRFTCQVVEGDRVKIDAEYTLDFTDSSLINTRLIIEWVFGGLMVVLVIIATFLIIYRMKVKMNNPKNQTGVQLPMQQYGNRDEADGEVVNYEDDEDLPASVRSTDQYMSCKPLVSVH
ncbi:uncharacterized protein LOC133418523 [Cololabis saira]|uniref:uncharacterized protein LOC133418523 n=1 Tax=Cololabis saira TaxID=129043 RepID=UPI002AD4C5C6|nr:uncharacterized protein LOC133418523 [Cololabis saira]